jgi:hypothetical protein
MALASERELALSSTCSGSTATSAAARRPVDGPNACATPMKMTGTVGVPTMALNSRNAIHMGRK